MVAVRKADGGDVFRRWRTIGKNEREDFNTVLTATLTLLALIIGFSFSMAVSRYNQRKSYEEAEANAIGTEYARADLLPVDDGVKLRELLRNYVNQRILFYESDEPRWNRIPAVAWILMGLIATVCNLLLGYRERSTGLLVLLVVPVVPSIAFFLIADIDSPRGGVIRVIPHNLIAVSQAMNARPSALAIAT